MTPFVISPFVRSSNPSDLQHTESIFQIVKYKSWLRSMGITNIIVYSGVDISPFVIYLLLCEFSFYSIQSDEVDSNEKSRLEESVDNIVSRISADIRDFHKTRGESKLLFIEATKSILPPPGSNLEANARWKKIHIRQNPMNLRSTTKGDKMRKEIRNCENSNGGYRILKSIVKSADIIDFYAVKHSAPKTSPRVKFQIFTGFKRRQNGRGD